MSDLVEESPSTQIIYDSTKSNSLMLSGTDIILANIMNTTEIKLNSLGIMINGDAGTAGQVLTSNGDAVQPSWSSPSSGWNGTATSNLDMNGYNITNASSMSLGNVSVATRLIGNVNISNSLTYGQTLQIYGGASYGTASSSADVLLATTYPNMNMNFTITLTGAGGKNITLPPAKAGYTITIINMCSSGWNILRTSPDMIYGASNTNAGLASIYVGVNKTYTFYQQPNAYYVINETISYTTIYGRNYNNNMVCFSGLRPDLAVSTTPYTMGSFLTIPVNTFVNMTGTASVITLFGVSVGQVVSGYTIYIRNNTSSTATIQVSTAALIYTTTSLTPVLSVTLAANKTMSLFTVVGFGYYITSIY